MTVQTYDLIIDDGRQRVLMSEPLKTYKDLPRFQSIASNNHKGYEAIWTICQKRLFLIHLNGFGEGQPGTPEDEGDLSGGASVTLETLFANHRGPVSADWFTGTLRIGHGRIAASLMEGWPLFEFEDEVELVTGAVINRKCYARKVGYQMQAPIVYSTLELLELPKEVQAQLNKMGCRFIGDLVRKPVDWLTASAQFTPVQSEQITEMLAKHGMSLGLDIGVWPPPALDQRELRALMDENRKRHLISES